MRRLRFIQLWLLSTTHRLAGMLGSRFASSPRERICGVIPQNEIAQRSHLASYPLSKQRCTSDSVSGRNTGILSMVASTRVISLSFAAPTAKPTGMPFVSVSKLLLTPFLPRSVGLGPLFFPSEGRFCHSSVHRQPRPVDAFGLIVFEKPFLPKTMKETFLRPVLETSMSSTAWANTRGIQRIPLTTSVQYKKNRIKNHPLVFGLSATFSRMRIFSGGNPWLDFLPKFIRDQIALFRHGLPSIKRVSPFEPSTSTV